MKLGDWWRGAPGLSSSELIDYIEWMDEGGAFKTTAERGGRWPEWKRMLSENTNEAYRFRAWYAAAHSTDEHDIRFDPTEFEFIDPVDQLARDEQDKRDAELAARTEPELVEAGW